MLNNSIEQLTRFVLSLEQELRSMNNEPQNIVDDRLIKQQNDDAQVCLVDNRKSRYMENIQDNSKTHKKTLLNK